MTKPYFNKLTAFILCLLSVVLLPVSNLLGVWLFAPLLLSCDVQSCFFLGAQDGTITALAMMMSACVMLIFCFLSVHLSTRSLTYTKQFFALGKFDFKILVKYLLMMALILGISELIMRYFDSQPLLFLEELLTPRSFWWLIIAIVVVAPIYEEVVFRGLMVGVIVKDDLPIFLNLSLSQLIAMLISSTLFALMHGQYDTIGVSTIFVLGLLFCHARLRHGLGLCMLLHFLNNLFSMMVYLSTTNHL